MAEKKQNFMMGAAILTASTLIVKVLGLLFSVPLANFISEAGMSYFYTAYDIFGIFLMLSTAGLPIAVSRMVGEAYSQGKEREADRVFALAFWLFFALGLVGCLVMFCFSAPIARMMGNPGAAHAIMALAPTMFFLSVMSALRGYFQGRSNMVPTAVSQTIEAVTKVVVGVGLAAYIISRYDSDAWAAVGAIVGVSVSAALGTVYLAFYKLRQTREDKVRRAQAPRPADGETGASSRQMLLNLIRFAVPITLGSCFLSLLDTVDAAILMERLQNAAGFALPQAESLRGVLGHARKFFDLPGAFVVPISTSLLPALSGALASGQEENARRLSGLSMRVTLLISLPATAGMCILSRPVCDLLLFHAPRTAASTAPLLGMLSVAIASSAVLMTTNAVLQSYGHPVLPVVNMTVGGVVKIVLSYLLIGDPAINAMGSALSTVASYFLMAALNLIAIGKLASGLRETARCLPPVLLSTLGMSLVTYGAYRGLALFMSPKLLALPVIVLAVAVYAILAVRTGAVTAELLRMLPKGELLMRVLRVKDTQ